MNFFCTKKHFTQWVETAKPVSDDLFILNLKDAFTVSQWIFEEREDQYKTPTHH